MCTVNSALQITIPIELYIELQQKKRKVQFRNLRKSENFSRSKSKQEKARRLFGASDESLQPAMPTVKPFFRVLLSQKIGVNYEA